MTVELTQRGGVQEGEQKKEAPPSTHRSRSFNRPLPEKFNVNAQSFMLIFIFMDSTETRKLLVRGMLCEGLVLKGQKVVVVGCLFSSNMQA